MNESKRLENGDKDVSLNFRNPFFIDKIHFPAEEKQ